MIILSKRKDKEGNLGSIARYNQLKVNLK